MNEAQRLISEGNYQEALVLVNKTLDRNPDDLGSLFQFGEIMLHTDRIGIAANIFRYLANKTNKSQAWNNLGRCFQNRRYADRAITYFKKALRLDPKSYAAMTNLAIMYVNNGNPELAKEYAEKALEIGKETGMMGAAHDALAMAKLHLHDFTGWDDFLHAEGPPFRKLRQYCVPGEEEWMGEPGKTVVIYREQGLGDGIFFAECLQDAINVSKQVILDVDERLVGLFARSFPDAVVFGTGNSSDISWPRNFPITHSAPIGRLPMFFRRSLSDFSGKPYMKADPVRKAAYRAALDSLGPGPKVGIAWTGGKEGTSDQNAERENRCLSLKEIEPLFLDGHHYISLQYNGNESHPRIIEWPWITRTQDYDDTAALVDELDYIIAVPTTVVHLAGALGKTCYCLTPEFHNWRFAGDMIYHESVKLFKGKDRVSQLRSYLET